MSGQSQQVDAGGQRHAGGLFSSVSKSGFDQRVDSGDHQQGCRDGDRQDDLQCAVDRAAEMFLFAARKDFRDGRQEGNCDRGAHQRFRNLHNKPSVVESGDRTFVHEGGHVIPDDEKHLDEKHSQHPGPKQDQHLPHPGVFEVDARRPSEFETDQAGNLNQQVQESTNDNAVNNSVDSET